MKTKRGGVTLITKGNVNRSSGSPTKMGPYVVPMGGPRSNKNADNSTSRRSQNLKRGK